MPDLVCNADAILQDKVVGIIDDVIQLLVRRSRYRRELSI
jgi:hypothetical protein